MSSPRGRSRVVRIWMVLAAVLLADSVLVVLPARQRHRLPHARYIHTWLGTSRYYVRQPVIGIAGSRGAYELVFAENFPSLPPGSHFLGPVLPFPVQSGFLTPFRSEVLYILYEVVPGEDMQSLHNQLRHWVATDPRYANLPDWCLKVMDKWSPASGGIASAQRISWPLVVHDAMFIVIFVFITFVPARALFRELKSRALSPAGICPFCRYDMTGTPGPVCPECGKRPR